MKADDYAIDDAEASRYRTEALNERFKDLERAQNAGHIKGIDVLEPALNLLADALRDSAEKAARHPGAQEPDGWHDIAGRSATGTHRSTRGENRGVGAAARCR